MIGLEFRNTRLLLAELLGDPKAELRTEQATALRDIMARDTRVLVVLPTGGGKTLLFALPVLGASQGQTVVVVPYRTLQADIVRRLREWGIEAAVWDADNVGSMPCKRVVVLTPEAANTAAFEHYVRRELLTSTIDRLVVDECHNILDASMRGWRPDYLTFMHMFREVPSVVLLTATLPPPEEPSLLDCVARQVGPVLTRRFATTRRNIRYSVVHTPASTPPNDGGDLSQVEKIAIAVQAQLLQLAARLAEGATCAVLSSMSLADTRELADHLGQPLYYSINNTTATIDETLQMGQNLELWASGKIRSIVATGILGEGTDFPLLAAVLHVGVPYQMTRLLQEGGRAARRGQQGESILIDHGGRARCTVVREYMQSSNCRRITIDRHMDGNSVRGPCGAGEVPCDNCERNTAVESAIQTQNAPRRVTIPGTPMRPMHAPQPARRAPSWAGNDVVAETPLNVQLPDKLSRRAGIDNNMTLQWPQSPSQRLTPDDVVAMAQEEPPRLKKAPLSYTPLIGPWETSGSSTPQQGSVFGMMAPAVDVQAQGRRHAVSSTQPPRHPVQIAGGLVQGTSSVTLGRETPMQEFTNSPSSSGIPNPVSWRSNMVDLKTQTQAFYTSSPSPQLPCPTDESPLPESAFRIIPQDSPSVDESNISVGGLDDPPGPYGPLRLQGDFCTARDLLTRTQDGVGTWETPQSARLPKTTGRYADAFARHPAAGRHMPSSGNSPTPRTGVSTGAVSSAAGKRCHDSFSDDSLSTEEEALLVRHGLTRKRARSDETTDLTVEFTARKTALQDWLREVARRRSCVTCAILTHVSPSRHNHCKCNAGGGLREQQSAWMNKPCACVEAGAWGRISSLHNALRSQNLPANNKFCFSCCFPRQICKAVSDDRVCSSPSQRVILAVLVVLWPDVWERVLEEYREPIWGSGGEVDPSESGLRKPNSPLSTWMKGEIPVGGDKTETATRATRLLLDFLQRLRSSDIPTN
jgi:superfamily II DNA helicase RecQ